MGLEAQLAKMQVEVERAVFFAGLWGLLAYIVSMLVLYFVIKTAIRDGLKESGLVEEIRRANRKSGEPIEPSFLGNRHDMVTTPKID